MWRSKSRGSRLAGLVRRVGVFPGPALPHCSLNALQQLASLMMSTERKERFKRPRRLPL